MYGALCVRHSVHVLCYNYRGIICATFASPSHVVRIVKFSQRYLLF